MENKENYICSLCQEQFQLNAGDYLFTYNAQCINNHKLENIELDDLLLRKEKNISIYQCKEHKKKIAAHCFLCNEDICLKCLSTSHKSHKMEYLKSLNLDFIQQFDTQNLLKKENKIINIFLSELKLFQKKLNTHINNIKSQIIKEIQLRQEFFDRIIKKEFTYIDIQNAKTFLENKSFKIINDNITKFCKSKTFIEKYDYIKEIINEGIQQGKYLENPNILNIVKKLENNIIPLNQNHFVQFDKNLKNNSTKLEIIKDNSDKYLKEFKINILSEKSFNFLFDEVILKINKNNEKEFSFYVINHIYFGEIHNEDHLYEVKILNILDNNKTEYEIKQIVFKEKILFIPGLIVLDNNKNIIFTKIGEISLYDDLFNKIEVLDNISPSNISDYLKINGNIFVYSTETNNTIYVVTCENHEFYKHVIQKCGNKFINYFENKKILISHDNENLYLINFNCLFPEIIQRIQIYNYTDYKYLYFIKNQYNYFKDDSIFLSIKQKSFGTDLFYLVYYIVQYKIDNDELKEVSRIEENRVVLKGKEIE